MMEVSDAAASTARNIQTKSTTPPQPQQWTRELEKAGAALRTAVPQAPGETLTQDEQAYFEQLFPALPSGVNSPAGYRKDGGKTASGVGTVIDRKG